MAESTPGTDTKKKGSSKAMKVVTILNVAIAGLSVGVAIGGLVLKFATSVVEERIKPVLTDIIGSVSSSFLDAIKVDRLDIARLLRKLATPMAILGFCALIVAGAGLFAACKKIIKLLIPYSIVVGAGALLQIVIVVVLSKHRNMLDGILKPTVLDSIRQYRGYNETNIESQAWTITMTLLQCCGSTDYRDFEVAHHWRRRLYHSGWWFELTTPLPCCTLDDKLQDGLMCAVNPSSMTSNHKRGCYAEAWREIEKYTVVPLIIIGILIAIQVILVIGTILIIMQTIQSRRNEPTGTTPTLDKLNPLSHRNPSITSNQIANGGLTSMAQNLAGSFPGISNADLLNQYVNMYRKSNTDGLLSQLIMGGGLTGGGLTGGGLTGGGLTGGGLTGGGLTGGPPSFYPHDQYNMPRFFGHGHTQHGHRSSGPVIVQLPGTPDNNAGRLHDHTMIAIEPPQECLQQAHDSPDIPRRPRRLDRCNSDDEVIRKYLENKQNECDFQMNKRDTYR